MLHQRDCKPCISCYQNFGCRCPECSEIQRLYTKRLKYDRHRGVPRLIDATPAREHCQKLLDAGMSIATLCNEAGLPYGTVAAVLGRGRKPNARVQRKTAKALLSVHYRLGRGTLVDATGTTRRLQDLATRGFGLNELVEATGINRDIISRIRSGKHKHIYPQTRDLILTAYVAFEGREPATNPSHQKALQGYAKRQRWAPLAAYDNPDSPFDKARARRYVA